MDDQTRRSITWVIIIAAVLIIATIASYRRHELEILTNRIAYGRPAERVDAVRTLVSKKKLMEALDGEPRWVMAKAVSAIPFIDTHGAYYELLTAHGNLDAPVQARDQSILTDLNNRGVEIFIEALKDNEAGPRGAAKQPLINIGNHIESRRTDGRNRVIDGCIRLLDAWDQYVRDLVRDILAAIATENVTDRLIPVMQQMEPQQKVLADGTRRKQTTQEFMRAKETARVTLAKMQAPAIDPVIEKLLTDENAEVRAAGCRLLGTIADRKHATPVSAADAGKCVGPLLDRLRRDVEWSVQRRAATALGLLREVSEDEGAVPTLIDHLSDRPEVKAAVAEALGRIGDPTAIEPLVQTLIANRQGATAELEIALTALGEDAIGPLGQALNSEQSQVRLIATRAVAEIGGPEAVVPLGQMLSDSDVRVRRVAANALRDTADERVLAEVAAALGDDDWQVYHAARDALARVGSSAVPILISSLGTAPRVSAMANEALRRIGKPALTALQSALSAEAGRAHWAALTMGEIGAAAVAPGKAVLEDRSKPLRARAYAAEALGHTGAHGAVEPLVDALGQRDVRVREKAVEALGRLADKRATEALVEALADGSAVVRDAAMDVLRNWHRGDIIGHLNRMAKAGDENARRRATILMVELTKMPGHELLEDFGGVESPLGEKARPERELTPQEPLEKQAEPDIDIAVLRSAATDRKERENVRRRAIAALGYAGDEASGEALMGLVAPQNAYAGEAAFAVARIGKRNAPTQTAGLRAKITPMGKALVDLLIESDNAQLRAQVGAAISLIGEQVSWELVDRLKTAEDSAKPWIIAALGACTKAALDPVLTARGNAEKDELQYKKWLASSLPLIGDQRALDLIDHLPDEEKPDPKRVRRGRDKLELIRQVQWD